MLKALNNVHEIFAELADLMMAKFRDMDEAWKSTVAWCTTFERIRRGKLREEGIEEREKYLQHKANKWRIFKDSPDQEGMYKAADYNDQWFKSSVAAFNTYDICGAGATTTCSER